MEKYIARALIAMSGGVDSSVAALRMLEKGYECAGVTMKLYRNEDIGADPFGACCSYTDSEDARLVCKKLGIPHETLSYRTEFRDFVIEKFIRTYENGATPNPCIDCNRYLKFGVLLNYAEEHGFSKLATGHYARIEYNGDTGKSELKKALDPAKDQSYVLYMLTQKQLAALEFPLGYMTKTEARALAEANGLVTAKKRESQDICFVPDGDYVRFMENYTGKTYPPGDFLDMEGNVIGRHEGAVKYTPGQRRGLRLPMGERVYVIDKSMRDNTVTVGENKYLYSDTVIAGDFNWISGEAPQDTVCCKAKPRYRAPEKPCAVTVENNKVIIRFDEPQRAVTPGQAIVLYDGEKVIGGGTILISN